MRRPVASLVAVSAALGLAVAASGSQESVGERMREAAVALDRIAQAHPELNFELDAPERFEWNYTPVERQGLALGVADERAQAAVWELVDTGLGERGQTLTRDVIRLEEVLYERSGGRAMRDPGRYYLGLYGIPGDGSEWAWRFEGHHLSLSFTLDDAEVTGTTPAFWGGNPAHVSGEGLHSGLRPFAREEDLARALLHALPEEARARALIADTTAGDVLTRNEVPAPRPPVAGVGWSDLDGVGREHLRALLDLYASRLAPELAAAEMAAIEAAGGLAELHFAWAGSVEPGAPHYYRIQGPTFVIEYDASQDDGNHVHTVWRNFDRDFGRDPLRAHLAAHHH